MSSPDVALQLPLLGDKITMYEYNFDICSGRFAINGMKIIIKKPSYNFNRDFFFLYEARLLKHSHTENLKKQHTV